jgi:hypothetical protein
LSPCIERHTSIDKYGYPRIGRKSAVRVLWERERGPIPEGYEPDHLCRNTLCVNLDHVEIVTKAENNGRAHRKLTADQVAEIRRAETGRRELATKFGVSYMTISNVQRGRNYV